jgi:hypothetical protein
MKKVIIINVFVILLCFSFACKRQAEEAERIIEDGVEVVINHLEPYKINGESNKLILEEIFSVDTESDEFLSKGFKEISNFDVDDEGNIYIIQWRAKEDYIFKIDSKGNIVKTFLRFGQGPGEIGLGGMIFVNYQNELFVKDPSKRKILVYDLEGNYLKETFMKKHYSFVPLKNGKYFLKSQEQNFDTNQYINYFYIGNSEFDILKELETFQFSMTRLDTSIKRKMNKGRLSPAISRNNIFVGDSIEGAYEIRIYDLDGSLVRKIRKKYKQIKISEKDKKEYFDRWPEGSAWRKKHYFTNYWPAFRDIFVDEKNWLFVWTREEGINIGEEMFDIFNPDGVFIGRISLNFTNIVQRNPIKIKNNRLYCIREKETGYQEIVVYKMEWK